MSSFACSDTDFQVSHPSVMGGSLLEQGHLNRWLHHWFWLSAISWGRSRPHWAVIQLWCNIEWPRLVPVSRRWPQLQLVLERHGSAVSRRWKKAIKIIIFSAHLMDVEPCHSEISCVNIHYSTDWILCKPRVSYPVCVCSTQRSLATYGL